MEKTVYFLIGLMCLFVSACPVGADGHSMQTFSGSGSGTAGDPYIITNCDQLQEMKDALSAYYQLGNDIDCSATVDWNGGAGFGPVGDDVHHFTGRLEGQGHTISGLYINRAVDYVGLFGYIDNDAVVQKFTLADLNITGKTHVGAAAGYAKISSVTDIDVEYAQVAGNTNVGGLIGYAYASAITHCRASGDVRGQGQVGGLVGKMDASSTNHSTITQCTSTAKVIGAGTSGSLGGLIGEVANYSDIEVCQASGMVDGAGNNSVGGLVGYTYHCTIEDSAFGGNVVGNNSVGGLVGYCRYTTIKKSSVKGSAISGNEKVGGFIGNNEANAKEACDAKAVSVSGYVDVGGFVGQHASGTISLSSCKDGSVVMGTNKTGGFVGNNGATIQKCYSSSAVVAGGDDIGGFVGYNNYSITDCFAQGDVEGGCYVGGFAGGNYNNGSLLNSYSVGYVEGANNVGGFSGWDTGVQCADCFWDIDTSGKVWSACGTGEHTPEMQQRATFDPSWDFATIWGIDESETYPYIMQLSPSCGDPWHPYPAGDLNYDCVVNLVDFAIFAGHWLESSKPGGN